jgi:hypothetical protein
MTPWYREVQTFRQNLLPPFCTLRMQKLMHTKYWYLSSKHSTGPRSFNIYCVFLLQEAFYFLQNESNFCSHFLDQVSVNCLCSDSTVTHRKAWSRHYESRIWRKSRQGLMTYRILMWKVSGGCVPDTNIRFWLHWNTQNIMRKTCRANCPLSLTHSFRWPTQWLSWKEVRTSASSGKRK